MNTELAGKNFVSGWLVNQKDLQLMLSGVMRNGFSCKLRQMYRMKDTGILMTLKLRQSAESKEAIRLWRGLGCSGGK
jgi:hypothetical protein